MKHGYFLPLFCSLLLATPGLQSQASAHGVKHPGNEQHRQLAGFDLMIELHRLDHYQRKFGTATGLEGSHILTVRLLDQAHPVPDAQIRARMIGPAQQTIGPESGQSLILMPAKGRRQHYATAYHLSQKGNYTLMILINVGGKLSQAAFHLRLP